MTSIGDAINSVIQAKADAVKSQVSFAVMAKTLQVTQGQGEAANQLIEAAAQLSKEAGKGLHFDSVG